MKCTCGRFVTNQARVIANIYEAEAGKCIHCIAEAVSVPYRELVDRYMGIYDCRPCAQNKKKEEIRRKLLGLG